MKNKKSLLVAGATLALAAVVAFGSTLAYFTDTDEEINVFTIGDVDIDQIEEERDENGELVDFTQAKPLNPTYYPGDSIPWDDAGNWPVANNEAWKVVESDSNVIDKFVTVENTGKNDVYVRTIIAYEGDAISGTDIHIVTNTTNVDPQIAVEYIENVIIDGTRYDIAVYTYPEALAAGATTIPSLKQVYMDKNATQESVAVLGDTYEILVVSQAVQADSFADEIAGGWTAGNVLDVAFGDITATAHPWSETAPVIPVVVSNADELIAALEAGEDVVLTETITIDPANMSNAYGKTGINVKNGQTINGENNTIDIKGAGGTWDSGINTTGGIIENVTITGSFRGIFINHNSTHSEPVILNNVTIDGTVYTISCDQGLKQTLTATDSTFNGWTSYAATLGEATFIDCSFGEGNGYAYCRPYAPTTFENCEFEAGYTLDARAAVTFINCTLDGVLITADNVDTLVTASSVANVTVK